MKQVTRTELIDTLKIVTENEGADKALDWLVCTVQFKLSGDACSGRSCGECIAHPAKKTPPAIALHELGITIIDDRG